MFAIGEALLGTGNEVAHIDLIIGDKKGSVGQAFASGLSQLSPGHTPLLAVIRPNLLAKPSTLIIPKVTVKDLDQASKVFGPAQYAVAKAVTDSLEEGVIPPDKLDDWVIICGVFIHPEAKDFRKLYQHNYGATKLALKRALSNYPDRDKLLYEKDRAVHPIMGFRVPRLWRPPYLQVALDIPDIQRVKQVMREIPRSDQLILEAGTPLIKKYGVRVIKELREVAGNTFIIADLKTLDVGQVEVDLAFEETADAVIVSGSATKQTIEKFINEAKKCGIYAFLDLTNIDEPIPLLKSLKETPEAIILHRAIDAEHEEKQKWKLIRSIKNRINKKMLVAVAGGIAPENVQETLTQGADIVVVGRYITQSKDVTHSTREFLRYMGSDIDLFRVHYATE